MKSPAPQFIAVVQNTDQVLDDNSTLVPTDHTTSLLCPGAGLVVDHDLVGDVLDRVHVLVDCFLVRFAHNVVPR